MQLIGRSIVVAGGAQGMGLGIARHLLGLGGNVTLLDLRDEAVQAAARQLNESGLPGRAAALHGSATSAADVASVFDLAEREFGPAQILINNVGGAVLQQIVDTSDEQWQQVFDLCGKSTFFGTREFARRLGKTSLPGAIVNVSSVNARAASEGMAAMCSAKAAVNQFTRVAALELAASGVTVNAVEPGLTSTPAAAVFSSGAAAEAFTQRTPLGRIGVVEDIAGVVAFLCSDDARWMTGACLPVDGGLHLRGVPGYWPLLGGSFTH